MKSRKKKYIFLFLQEYNEYAKLEAKKKSL